MNLTSPPPLNQDCHWSRCELDYDSDGPSSPLLRCSSCKNAFYHNSACQKAAWKAYHQLNCSPLPLPLPAPKLEVSAELDAEAERLIQLLRAVKESWKDVSTPEDMNRDRSKTVQEADLRKQRLATDAAVALSQHVFSPPFALPNIHKISPRKHLKVSATRLALLYHLSHLPSRAAADALAEMFGGIQSPCDWAELYGPKVVCIPDKLSVGEYEMLAQNMMIFTYTGEPKEKEGETEEDKQVKKIAEMWMLVRVVFATIPTLND